MAVDDRFSSYLDEPRGPIVPMEFPIFAWEQGPHSTFRVFYPCAGTDGKSMPEFADESESWKTWPSHFIHPEDSVSNLQTVLDFIQAMQVNEKKGILAFFDDESKFNNVPMGVVHGAEGVWSVLGPLHETVVSVEYVIHHIAESAEGVVLTERTDRYRLEDRLAEFPVMGSFHVTGKIIRQWTDYFDLKQCLDQMPRDTELPI